MRFTWAHCSNLFVSLDGVLLFRHVNHTTELGIIHKLAESALDSTVDVIDEDF